MTFEIRKLTATAAIITSLCSLQPLSAATYYWDTNGATAGSGAATGTWDSSTSALWTTDSTGSTATSAVTTASTDAILFSAGTNGTTGTVTVSGTQAANTIALNQSGLTFSGGTINLGNGATGTLTVNASATINSAMTWKNITFSTTGQSLTLAGGSSGGFNGNISGSSTAIAAASTLTFSSGTYAATGAGHSMNIGNVAAETGGVVFGTGTTVTPTGTFQTGNSGTGLVTVSGGTLNVNSSGLVSGRGSGTNIGKIILSSGTINTSAATPILIGFQLNSSASSGTFNVTGGTLNALSDLSLGSSSSAGSATANISGGTSSVVTVNFGKGGAFAASTGGSGTLNVSGGILYVGSGGMVNNGTGTYTSSIALSGGTVGASANWSSSMNMGLSNASGGVTFKTANASDAGRTITLSGVLSGTGGLNVTGGTTGSSLLTLQGINTYTGNTTVQSTGILSLADNAALTFVIGASGVNNSISGTGTLNLDGDFVFDLSGAAASGTWNIVDVASLSETFGSTFTVTGWTDMGGDMWSKVSGGSTYYFSETTGVLSTVPEPSTYALVGMGLGVLWMLRRSVRKDRKQA